MKNFPGRLRPIIASAAALASIMSATVVEAQQGGLEEIVVTAQFREQLLQDTPIAITAIGGEEIENKAMNSIIDIAATSPNVTIARGSSAFGSGTAVYIRGIGQYDTNFALEPGVGMYVDDIYHGVMAGSIFDLLDLDRVEIMRGPQGTLSGRNSIGGAVKMFSREPDGSGEGFMQATLGDFDRVDFRGAYDFALTDTLNMRLSAFSKRRDGHVTRLDLACDQPGRAGTLPVNSVDDSCVIGTMGGVSASGARVALKWQASDDVEVSIIGMATRDDSEAGGSVLAFAKDAVTTNDGINYADVLVSDESYTNYGSFDDLATGLHYEPMATMESESISGKVVWKISDSLELTSITGYENMDTQWTIDDLIPFASGLTYNNSPYKQFTQEVRLNGEFADANIEWTLGGFYFEGKGHVAARVLSGAILNFLQDDPVDSTSKAIFAHAMFRPSEEMTITAGVRYTDDTKDYTFYRQAPGGGPAFIVGALDGVSRSYSGDNVDFRVSLDYRFTDNLFAYGSFSTGYKGGGINPRPFIPTQVVSFDPETVDALEVGLKMDFLDNMLRVNAAVFLNQYKDVILVDANGFPGSPGDASYFPFSAVPFNAGDADIKGFEIEAFVEPGNGLSISASLSYLDFEYTKLDSNATESGIGFDYISPFTPEWKASINASYEFNLESGSTVTPQIYASYMSEVYTDPNNGPTNLLDEYAIVNANVSYSTANSDWELILGVTNLADKYYYTNGFDVYNITGSVQNTVARPREWYLSARRDF